MSSSSPCIDTGTMNAAHNDIDGSRNDIGLYGGPNSWAKSGPIITNMHITPTSVKSGESINIQATGVVE